MSDPNKYTVGWICALPTEFSAARAFLDEEHGDPHSVDRHDNNSYALGRIGSHNIVIAVLPDGEYGTTSAAVVAQNLLRTFQNIRIGLMVGIGGGAPTKHDVRLGDVVVSSRDGGKGGVFQYDYGKALQNQDIPFEHTDFLDQPPTVLRSAVSKLKSEYEMKGHQIDSDVARVFDRWPRLRKKYSRPPSESDRLYRPGVVHGDSSKGCGGGCSGEPSAFIARELREEEEDDPVIHYGLIASANTLMKDAHLRDKLATEYNILCYEMEAAGLMNHFPCLVIRGICDYSDSHKNKQWQGFAAMAAAAYAKDLLHQILPSKVESERPIREALGAMKSKLDEMHSTVGKTESTILTMQSNEQTERIRRWLSPADYSDNANEARKRRHIGTGTWLLESTEFLEWEQGSRQHLWLYGLAGCGKTVLSTTVLDHLRKRNQGTTLAFFFNFNDPGKQTLKSMLHSLAFQLYHSGGEAARQLDNLFASCHNGERQPEMGILSTCLALMAQVHPAVCIVLDALDECSTRTEMLDWLKSFDSSAKLIVTGRPEGEFEREIPPILGSCNCLQLQLDSVNADISSFVRATLEENFNFVRKNLSPQLLQNILDMVGDGAEGMFRWAACQLDVLAKCLSPNDIETALQSLPSDLDETYRRMLQAIPSNYKDHSIRLLQFLVYAQRPLKLSEAVEVIATQIQGPTLGFKPGNRLFQEADVLLYCPSLVSTVQVSDGQELHLAHFSVKEYLLKEPQFDLKPSSTNITKICLTYLTDMTDSDMNVMEDFPMAQYAADTWMTHAAMTGDSDDIIQIAINFLEDERAFQRWSLLHNIEPWSPIWKRSTRASLYYACFGGLRLLAKELLVRGADINAQNCGLGTALQAASFEGHSAVVQLLINEGADVNMRGGGTFTTALQTASFKGHFEIVQLLLNKGADVNAQGGDAGTALLAASHEGHLEIVQLLLDKGADVNAQGGEAGTALLAASHEGHVKTVKLLLNWGADVNAEDEDHTTGLYYASYGGHLEIVQLLIDRGADVNVQGGGFGAALQAASYQGHLEIVQLLLNEGANVNASSDNFHVALDHASCAGHVDIVKLLVKRGANLLTRNGD